MKHEIKLQLNFIWDRLSLLLHHTQSKKNKTKEYNDVMLRVACIAQFVRMTNQIVDGFTFELWMTKEKMK